MSHHYKIGGRSGLTLSRLANTGMYDRELTATAKAALFVFAWRGRVDWMKDKVTFATEYYQY